MVMVRPGARPTDPWPTQAIARAARVGSLEHTIALIDGGMNDPDNFAWSCQWCNANRHGRTDLIPRTLAGCRPSVPRGTVTG